MAKKKTTEKEFVVIVYKDDSLVSYCHKSEIDLESEDLELVSEHDTQEEALEAQRTHATEKELTHQY